MTMDSKETFHRFVTNQYIPQLDYYTYELRFQTVFKVSEFSYQCCPCALEHEFVTYIANDGTIDEGVYDRILKCITEGKCPHVGKTTKDATAETKVNAIHIAAAANTELAFKKVPNNEQLLLCSSLFYLTPNTIALLKENVSLPYLSYWNGIVCNFIEKNENPYTVEIRWITFRELCVLNQNPNLLTKIYEVWHTPRQLNCLPLVDLFGLVLQYQSMDMRELVLRMAPTNTDPDTLFKVCELAILYEDHKLLEDLLQKYDMYRTHTLTKRLKELSSALNVKSCTDILSAYLTFDVVLPTTRSSIVLTLLTAVMITNDSKVHRKIIRGLKQIQNISELVNDDVVKGIVFKELVLGRTDVLRTILDLGLDVNRKNNGETLLDKILQDFVGCLSHRMAVEIILYENPDLYQHSQTSITALKQDIFASSFQNEFKGLIFNVDCCMDAKEHGRFGHDGDAFALNYFGHLLFDCGFRFHRHLCDLLTKNARGVPQKVVERIIPNRLDVPRSLQLLCRDSLRQHYKGRQIHAFAERRTIPPRIRDFILLKPSLKTIQHLFV